MPDNGMFVSDSALREKNRGAYASPFSGVGIEFFPLGVTPDHSGLVLHEAGYLPHNDWWEFPRVLSPFWRLYYNARPGHRVVFAEGEFELDPDHLVLIPDHQLFHCYGREPVPNLWLHFNLARRPSPRQQVPIVLRPTASEASLIGDLRDRFRCGVAGFDRDRIFHSALALLHAVLSRPELQWQGCPPSAVMRVVRYVEQHYRSRLSVPRLAEMVGLCTESLARQFKRFQGETLGRFIVKIRVREAAHLLTHTAQTIDQVAERTGFPNRAYLSRVFKQITGQSPAEFRRLHARQAL